jgi:hypothetical protein
VTSRPYIKCFGVCGRKANYLLPLFVSKTTTTKQKKKTWDRRMFLGNLRKGWFEDEWAGRRVQEGGREGMS